MCNFVDDRTESPVWGMPYLRRELMSERRTSSVAAACFESMIYQVVNGGAYLTAEKSPRRVDTHALPALCEK